LDQEGAAMLYCDEHPSPKFLDGAYYLIDAHRGRFRRTAEAALRYRRWKAE
jgi:hypothetical protein